RGDQLGEGRARRNVGLAWRLLRRLGCHIARGLPFFVRVRDGRVLIGAAARKLRGVGAARQVFVVRAAAPRFRALLFAATDAPLRLGRVLVCGLAPDLVRRRAALTLHVRLLAARAFLLPLLADEAHGDSIRLPLVLVCHVRLRHPFDTLLALAESPAAA